MTTKGTIGKSVVTHCQRTGRRHEFTADPQGEQWGHWCGLCGYRIPSEFAKKVFAGNPGAYGALNQEVVRAAIGIVGDLKSLRRDIDRLVEEFESTDNPEEPRFGTADRFQVLAWFNGKFGARYSNTGTMVAGTINEELAAFTTLVEAAKRVTAEFPPPDNWSDE